ncbi:MAG: gliding motility-associated C-terminal domain-containing protein [Bacteroidota bacterium]
MPRSLLTLLLVALLCTCGRAQTATGSREAKSEGTDFWFTFLEHRDPDNNKVVLISARQATTGTVTIPGANFSQNFTVAANGVARIPLPAGAETLGSERVSTTAVHVTSAAVVSVYIHQYFGFRSEASLVLPTPALGTDYRVLAYSGRPDPVNYPSTFAVVATEDATEITISDLPAATEGGRQPGAAITRTLNRGQVFQVRAADGVSDLTGTSVQATAPVAVYAGAAWSFVTISCNAADNLLEINFPVSQWGRRYLGVPTLRNNEHVYRVLADEDGTEVRYERGSTVRTATLSAGEFFDIITGEAVLFTATKPIMVAQFLLGSECNGHPLNRFGDPSYFLLSELTQTLDTVTVFNSNFQDIDENFLNITFRAGDEVGIQLDGAPLTSPITLAPGGEYAYTRVQVSDGSHTITSSGCGVIVTVYGYGDIESYAYNGGSAFRNINGNPIVEGGCLNDTIRFVTGLDTLRFRHEWTLEDGTVETRADFLRFYDELGEYPIRLILYDECLDQADTSFRDLRITLRRAVEITPDQRVCVGEPVRLEASDLPGATYLWTGPDNLLEESQALDFAATGPNQAGDYTAIGIVSGCATFPVTARLTVDTLPRVQLRGDSAFCPRDPRDLAVLDAGDFAGYQWSNGRSGNPLEVRIPGLYTVSVSSDQGCVGTDSITVAAFCPVQFYIPNAFSPNADGINDVFRVEAVDAAAVRLRVYDRWGGEVFVSTSEILGWDGREAAVGTYTYLVEIEGFDENGRFVTRTKAGTVVLVR